MCVWGGGGEGEGDMRVSIRRLSPIAEEEGVDLMGEISPPDASTVAGLERLRVLAPPAAAAALARERSTFCSEIVMASEAKGKEGTGGREGGRKGR